MGVGVAHAAAGVHALVVADARWGSDTHALGPDERRSQRHAEPSAGVQTIGHRSMVGIIEHAFEYPMTTCAGAMARWSRREEPRG